MDRNTAVELVLEKVKNKNLRKHIFAVEAVMKALAVRFGADAGLWGLAGILHDLDYEVTDETNHTLVAEKWLKEHAVAPEIINAVKAHADKAPRNTMMEKAIYCADPVTGFIVACALIRPDKKLEPVTAEFAIKRMKEKRFAAGASREAMSACSEIGLTLEEFFETALNAMKKMSDELGL